MEPPSGADRTQVGPIYIYIYVAPVNLAISVHYPGWAKLRLILHGRFNSSWVISNGIDQSNPDGMGDCMVMYINENVRIINMKSREIYGSHQWTSMMFSKIDVAEINECSSNPCKNGATCHDSFLSYTCDCADGWKGGRCKTSMWTVWLFFKHLGHFFIMLYYFLILFPMNIIFWYETAPIRWISPLWILYWWLVLLHQVFRG